LAVSPIPLHSIVETTLAGLGYELVELEFGGRGLLRIYIDFIDWKAHAGEFIKIEDCEKATRQLTHVLTVEDVDYARLEVSSPGIDRPLNRHADFERFAGIEVSVKLKKLFEGRRHFEGVLSLEEDGKYSVLFDAVEKKAAGLTKLEKAKGIRTKAELRPIPKQAKGATPVARLKLTFTLEEADKVRLVPQISFRQAAEKGTAE
jgi:ribosome maturation factor RimP